MVTITRVLSLKEYEAANDLALRKGTAKQRRNHLLYIQLGPYVGAVLLLLGISLEFVQLRRDRDEYAAIWLIILGIVILLQRWILRRKLKKLHHAQQMDRPWTVEAGEDGVRSFLPGLADSRLEWRYFTAFAETDELFVLINSRRPAFLSFPKRSMTEGELTELRNLAGLHIPDAVRS